VSAKKKKKLTPARRSQTKGGALPQPLLRGGDFEGKTFLSKKNQGAGVFGALGVRLGSGAGRFRSSNGQNCRLFPIAFFKIRIIQFAFASNRRCQMRRVVRSVIS